MDEKENPSSVQLSAPAHFQLKRIASFTNLNQSTICEDFIQKLYNAMHRHMLKALETGELITYSIDVHAGIGIQTTSGQFPVPMDMEETEVEKIRDARIEREFAQLDKEVEQRKKHYRDGC
jgi:hypothetical protein